jgi:hypothetical protein
MLLPLSPPDAAPVGAPAAIGSVVSSDAAVDDVVSATAGAAAGTTAFFVPSRHVGSEDSARVEALPSPSLVVFWLKLLSSFLEAGEANEGGILLGSACKSVLLLLRLLLLIFFFVGAAVAAPD